MKTVTIGFSTKHRNLLSWIIRKQEGRDFSHVYIKATCPYINYPWLFQATIPFVTLTNPSIFATQDSTIAEIDIPVTDEENLAVLTFFAENTGKTYAASKLFGILWKRLVKDWFGKSIKAPSDDQHKTEECSEAAALVLKILGLQTTEDLESVGPGWVYDQALLMANQRKK